MLNVHSFSPLLFTFFIIIVPPDILDYPTSTDMVIGEGSNTTLKCAATGSPVPVITWRRESGEPIPITAGQDGEWIYMNFQCVMDIGLLLLKYFGNFVDILFQFYYYL